MHFRLLLYCFSCHHFAKSGSYYLPCFLASCNQRAWSFLILLCSISLTFIQLVWLCRLCFCTKPKNSVLIFQELRFQKSSKTQFLPENSVLEQWIYENFHQKLLKKDNFRHFSPETPQIFRKLSSKKAKTQFSRNS